MSGSFTIMMIFSAVLLVTTHLIVEPIQAASCNYQWNSIVDVDDNYDDFSQQQQQSTPKVDKSTKFVHSDWCHTDCHTCVDKPMCTTVLDNMQTLHPLMISTFPIQVIYIMANWTVTCREVKNSNAESKTYCGGSLGGGCYNTCPICYDIETCESLMTQVNATYTYEKESTLANNSSSYTNNDTLFVIPLPDVFKVTRQSIINICKDVTTNDSEHFAFQPSIFALLFITSVHFLLFSPVYCH